MSDLSEIVGLLTSHGAVGVLAVAVAALGLLSRYLFKQLQASQDARIAEGKANAAANEALLREAQTAQNEMVRAMDRLNPRSG